MMGRWGSFPWWADGDHFHDRRWWPLLSMMGWWWSSPWWASGYHLHDGQMHGGLKWYQIDASNSQIKTPLTWAWEQLSEQASKPVSAAARLSKASNVEPASRCSIWANERPEEQMDWFSMRQFLSHSTQCAMVIISLSQWWSSPRRAVGDHLHDGPIVIISMMGW